MTTLAETQKLLWSLITAPDGVAAALAADTDRGGELAVTLEETVRGDGRVDAAGRVDIYGNMYFYRILDVLKEDYPAVLAVLGGVAFHNLVTDYLLVHAPAHPSLRYVGRHLPEFIESHHPLTRHPYLADLARMERALSNAFDAADAAVLTTEDLATISAERWSELTFSLHPSLRTLELSWPVHEIRTRVDRGAPCDFEPARIPTVLCVWRHDYRVYHRALDDAEALMLKMTRIGETFGTACVAAVADLGTAPQDLAAMLRSWVAHGWLSRVLVKPAT